MDAYTVFGAIPADHVSALPLPFFLPLCALIITILRYG